MGDVARGWELFALADWQGARDAFQSALEAEPGDPDALDGLGQASWWMGERDAAIDYRREAFAGYRRAGSSRDAARLAIYLAGEHRIDGMAAAANGWIGRARRLLADERARARDRLARDRGGQAGGRSGRGGAARARGARHRSGARGPRRRVHGTRPDRPCRGEQRARGGGDGSPRRGDGRGPRRRDERPAGVRRCVLYHPRRLRQDRGSAPGQRVVRRRGGVHRAPPLHARAVLVPLDLRSRARARGGLGAGRDRAHRGARPAR